MSRRRSEAGASAPGEPERPRAGLLLDDLAEQLHRFRLLPGGSEADAERVLAGLTPASAREREATKELANRHILAHADRFEDAHHLAVKALEVFDRHGWRGPRMPRWLIGPLAPIAQVGVEQVTHVIVRSHARTVANTMRRLYARREAQCNADQPERRVLARARIAMTRLSPDFGGGGSGLPRFLVGGAVISALLSTGRQVGGLSNGAAAWVGLAVAAAVVFAAVSWVIVQGAAVAHRRSRLILREPLDALWETIGACGNPPRDDSMTFAAVGIVLTAVAWFVTPAIVAAVFYLT